jgi:glutamate/tyrosine decarboxylase-like PLP-dependent enzyme
MTALFPPDAERRRAEDRLTTALREARTRVAAGAVAPTLNLEEFRADLAEFDFARPLPQQNVVPWVIEQLEHGVTHTTHPRYFGLFNPAPSFPAECAERIVAQFNPQLASATTSPAAVEIEAHVIAAVARRTGLPDGAGGHFTSGGSEANFTALICALSRAEPAYAQEGIHAFASRPVFYVSADAHLAWLKIAVQAGLGRAAMRPVATDGTGRMDPAALSRAIAEDRAQNCRPVMIVATAGTTGAGMVDPLADCTRIARAHGAWLHVDAAWGGALIASPRLRGALAGIEHADSVTIDAHKWFATTMSCGMFLVRDADLLGRVFQAANSFMPSNAVRDPYVTSVQWSRRFLGLRLFLSLATAGWAGFAAHVEHAVATADRLSAALSARGWTVANHSRMAVLCLLPPPGWPAPRTLVQRVVASGEAWISAARLEGQDVVRICVTHGQTTEEDLHALIQALHASAQPSAPASLEAACI